MMTDRTPRYTPETVMTLKGIRPVVRAIAHPPGSHPASPIKNEMTAVELVTEAGSRWYGCERAWINSDLRMVVQGCDSRDEARMSWSPVSPEREG